MHRLKGKALFLGGGLALIAGFVLLLGSLGGTSTVQATDPAPTPKNDNLGNLAGTYDIVVPGPPSYHCIIKVWHALAAPVANDIKTWHVCYADLPGLDDTGGEPPLAAGTGPNGTAGPVPPPPYGRFEPQGGTGSFAGGKLSFITCLFANVGAGAAPNVMASVTIPSIKTQLTAGSLGVAAGTITIYSNMEDANCATNTLGAAVGTPLPVTIYKVANKVPAADAGCNDSPFVGRAAACLNYDGDACSDEAELDGAKGCGDDPYNPLDSLALLTGTYRYTATVGAGPNCPVATPDQCPWDGTDNPGAGITYHCIASLNDPGPAITFPRTIGEQVFCYIDTPTSDVSMEGFPGCKGDGFPGASPPGKIRLHFQGGTPVYTCADKVVWAGASSVKSTQLTGTLTAKNLASEGCFEDEDHTGSLGYVYVTTTQDPYTGLGTVAINVYGSPFTVGDDVNCIAGDLTGSSALPGATLQAARQSSDLSFDSDGDGCSDAEELRKDSDEFLGGLRDPFNRWDVYDPAPSNGNGVLDPGDGDGVVDLFNDIFGVAFQYGFVDTDAGYDQAMDRAPPLLGSNTWNMPQADGTIDLFNDIFGVAFQFGLDCSLAP